MLHIILLILKIIGWIILILLGIIFFFLLAVLFIPVRYDGKGTFIRKGNGKIRFHWFLHIVSFQIKITDNKQESLLRILGIRIQPGKNKKPKQNTKRQRKRKEEEANPIDSPRKEAEEFQERIGHVEEAKDKIQHISDSIGDKIEDSEDNISIIGKVINKIRSIVQKILQIIQKIFNTGKYINQKWLSFQEFIEYEENKATFYLIIDQLKRILSHSGPLKWNVSLHFGLGNPAATGEALAVLACFIPIFKDNLQITPDFTQAVFEGEFYMRGRIRFFTLLIIILKVYRDKNFRKLLKKF